SAPFRLAVGVHDQVLAVCAREHSFDGRQGRAMRIGSGDEARAVRLRDEGVRVQIARQWPQARTSAAADDYRVCAHLPLLAARTAPDRPARAVLSSLSLPQKA